jgi:hypothetical protein
MVTMGILPYQGKITMEEPGIEPETSEIPTTRPRGWSFTDIYLYQFKTVVITVNSVINGFVTLTNIIF